MAISDALRILGLQPNFTPEQLKTAFGAKSRLHHPDVGGDPREMTNVNAANEVLKKSLDPKNLLVKKTLANSLSPEETAEMERRAKVNLGLDPDRDHSREDILQAKIKRAKNQLGLNPDKDHSREDVLKAIDPEAKQYPEEIKARDFLLKQLDLTDPLPEPIANLPILKKEIEQILSELKKTTIISAIMIFEVKEKRIGGLYVDHNRRKVGKLRKLSEDELRKTLFDLLVGKFTKEEDSGMVSMADALKPWRRIIRFLRKIEDASPFVDWPESTLSDIVSTNIDLNKDGRK